MGGQCGDVCLKGLACQSEALQHHVNHGLDKGVGLAHLSLQDRGYAALPCGEMKHWLQSVREWETGTRIAQASMQA